MRRLSQVIAAAAVMGVASLTGAPGALAAPDCPAGQVASAYSETCVESGTVVREDAGVAGTTTSGTTTSGRTAPGTLPFTGGEVVLAAAAGAAALAAGTALVVAGRRRAPSAA